MSVKKGVKRNKREVFLSELARHGSVRRSCLIAGVTRTWVREQRQDDQFGMEFLDAMEDSTDRIEECGIKKALKGDDKLVRFFLEVRRYKRASDQDMTALKPVINVTISK